MLNKLQAVVNKYEELCFKSEQPDFYADPKKAAKLLREKNDLDPIVEAYQSYRQAEQDMIDAEELMSDPEMKELCQVTFAAAKAQKEAEEMVAEAKVRAEEQLGNRGVKKEQLTAEVERLKTLATEYRAHFEALLLAQKEALDKASALFE